jgi:hypothetical protein
MKITQKQLRRVIKEELARLAERSTPGADFGFEPHGSERRIKADTVTASTKWKKFGADVNMAANAAQHAKDAVLDEDEEAAARAVEQLQKYAKLAYASLLGTEG